MDNTQSYWDFRSPSQPFSWGTSNYLSTEEPLREDIQVWAEELSRVGGEADDKFFEMVRMRILRGILRDYEAQDSN